MTVICPHCEYKADIAEFEQSLQDECWCPKCRQDFMLGDSDESEDES